MFVVRWTQHKGEEKRLPGLDLSPKQLFWVGAANVWCQKYRPKSLEMRIRTGAHSPGPFRVKGPFQVKLLVTVLNCLTKLGHTLPSAKFVGKKMVTFPILKALLYKHNSVKVNVSTMTK